MTWETVIGLEVHVQLATTAKLFSGSTTTFGAEPNTQACAIDLALPGVLPVLNEMAVLMAVKFGHSINAMIAKKSVFARKNYFYPDLPKGYQISQYDQPIVLNGYLDIATKDGSTKRINIVRAHLEEDAGKLLHEDFHGQSGIDFNRAGVPLIEIVSAPDFRSAQDAVTYLKTLHSLVRYLEISDANMQEGSFRCDINISTRQPGENLGTRTEIKNLNSFRFIEYAIAYEAKRQIGILENGGKIIQETRLYDPDKNETRSLRVKENAHDYRYFPDPDLLPLVLSDDYIAKIRQSLPELPQDKRIRFQQQYSLTAYDAAMLTATREIASYFEAAVKATATPPKIVANWINGELSAELNRANLDIDQSPIKPHDLALLLNRIYDQTISGKIAKEVFIAMWNGEGNANEIIAKKGLQQITDTSALEKIIDNIIATHPKQVAEYRNGKTMILGFLIGLVMKETKGKANPKQVNELLTKKCNYSTDR